MNKNAIRALIAAAFLTAGAAQASSSVNVDLSGSVPKTCAVSATPVAVSLEMDETGPQHAASVGVTCNYNGILKVSVSSQNEGRLKNANEAGVFVPYTVSVTGIPQLSGSIGAGFSNIPWPTSLSGPAPFSVTLASHAGRAGAYSDRVTISVAPN